MGGGAQAHEAEMSTCEVLVNKGQCFWDAFQSTLGLEQGKTLLHQLCARHFIPLAH